VGAPIWTKFGSLMQKIMQITANWSISKLEVEFQHGGRLYLENGNSYISATDRRLIVPIGFYLSHRMIVPIGF